MRAREVDGSGMKKGDEEEKMEVLIRREMEEVERLLRYFRRVGEEAVGGGDCHGGDLAKGGLKSLSISSANGLTDGVWKVRLAFSYRAERKENKSERNNAPNALRCSGTDQECDTHQIRP